VLARVELGPDWDEAVALQHQFKLRATGSPALPEIPKTPIFELENLPGVEAFEAAEVALDSEPDLNPGLEPLQEKARAIAEAVKDPAERARVDKVIRTLAFADFAKGGRVIGHGTIRNGWARPAVSGTYNIDYLARSLINYGGIWANVQPEVLYYRASIDGTGAALNGNNAYTLTFTEEQLPANFAEYFWSVTAWTRPNSCSANPKNPVARVSRCSWRTASRQSNGGTGRWCSMTSNVPGGAHLSSSALPRHSISSPTRRRNILRLRSGTRGMQARPSRS
jgi:hypothetical protein